MADNSLGGLYMRLGLSLDDLETDFIAAERTTRENLNRLNRERNLIRLRAEVAIGNLDETADAIQILTVRESALNQQMAIQRDRIRLAEATYRDLEQRLGASATATQRAAAALERERLALQRLERELREVTEAQEDFNEGQSGAGDFADGLSDLSDLLPQVSGKLGVGLAAVTALKEGIDLAASAVSDLHERFHELQNQSYELNMPVSETKDFLRKVKMAGGDIGDYEGYIRGITDAYVKGEFDDPEFIALEKYGAKIVDATGKLKSFEEIHNEVLQAFRKAKAEGQEIEFLQLTGGEAGVRDAIQLLERWNESEIDNAKILNADVNAEELHKLERALNLATEQEQEFRDATADLITPFAIESLNILFEIFHSGTEFLVENKEEIQHWGFIAGEVIKTVLDPLKELKTTMSNAPDDSFLGVFKNTAKNQAENIISGPLFKFLNDVGAFDGIIQRATENQIAYNNAVNSGAASWATFREEEMRAAESQSSPLNQYDTKRITAFRDELEDLLLERKYADDEFGLAIAQNDLWLEREMTRKNFLSEEEKTALKELHEQKRIDIERRQADEIAKIQEDAARRSQDLLQSAADIEYGLTHSAFEKQIYDIEQWEKKSLESIEKYKNALEDKGRYEEEAAAIAVAARAKEEEAFKREMDRIQGRIESAQDRLMRLTSSQKDYDLYKAQKQYQQDLKDGIPQGLAKAIYDAEVAEIGRRSRSDKGGSYSKSKNNSRGNPYIIEFDTPKQTDWTKINPQDLAFNTLAQNNRQLAESVRNVIGAQGDLIQSIHHTAEGFEIIEGDKVVQSSNNSNSSDHEIEIIEGDRVVKRGSVSYQNAQQKLNQVPDYNQYLQGMPEIINRMARGDTEKSLGGYGAKGAEATNFSNLMKGPGLADGRIISYLDRISTGVERLCETAVKSVSNPYQHIQQQSPNITVSPNINVDLGGAYVFDDAMKKQLTEDVTNEVVTAVKDAFQQAKDSSNYRYGN